MCVHTYLHTAAIVEMQKNIPKRARRAVFAPPENAANKTPLDSKEGRINK